MVRYLWPSAVQLLNRSVCTLSCSKLVRRQYAASSHLFYCDGAMV